jgi:hypothetical protein
MDSPSKHTRRTGLCRTPELWKQIVRTKPAAAEVPSEQTRRARSPHRTLARETEPAPATT